jgi:hypothetical protein
MHQRLGVGPHAYGFIENFVGSWSTCDRVRIGVARTNGDVIPIWNKLGFKTTGEIHAYQYASVTSETPILEKPLRIPNLKKYST